MQLVIDIDEEDFEIMKHNIAANNPLCPLSQEEVVAKIANGTPLCGKMQVLDKIRAEIEEQVLESLSDGGDDWFAAEKVNECLEIIDKYKVESEE